MNFSAQCKATAIGSFPHSEAEAALSIIMKEIPQIPVWPQLPHYPEEGMIRQFNEGMPGLVKQRNKIFFDTLQPRFEAELMHFYEEYFHALDIKAMPLTHPLGISPHYGRGFYALVTMFMKSGYRPAAIKGQITGPITLATTITDQDGKSAYYDRRLREVVVKTLTIKAKWQIHQLRTIKTPIIIFIDEPSLAVYGSSAFLGISAKDVVHDLQEVIEQIHAEGAIAGLHCCENTDWGLLMKTDIDILNFDAYGFFDRVILYGNDLQDFLNRGKMLAWGLIPTGNPEDLRRETAASLTRRWKDCVKELVGLGVEPERVMSQSLLTPSCGTGSLTPELSEQVMSLLREVAEILQEACLTKKLY